MYLSIAANRIISVQLLTSVQVGVIVKHWCPLGDEYYTRTSDCSPVAYTMLPLLLLLHAGKRIKCLILVCLNRIFKTGKKSTYMMRCHLISPRASVAKNSFTEDGIYTRRVRFGNVNCRVKQTSKVEADMQKLRSEENMTITAKQNGAMVSVFKLLGYLSTN